MKTIWSLVAMPLICGAIWFFFSWQVAAVVMLVYLQVTVVMLLDISEQQKAQLAEMSREIEAFKIMPPV